jgi:FkbH-like protein
LPDNLDHLGWLPEKQDWGTAFELAQASEPEAAVAALLELAHYRIDFIQTARLDRAVQKRAGQARARLSGVPPVRLALLGSSTLTHLIPGIRIGALRRGVWAETYEGAYGGYRQELQDPASGLHTFRPDVILLALDARHLTAAPDTSIDRTLREIRDCWRLAKESLGCIIVQQTVLPALPSLLGSNEHRLAESPLSRVYRLNQELRGLADAENVELLAVDAIAAERGVWEWWDEALWHRSKQEIHPRVSHLYGDHVGRLLGAIRGRSYKCLVLDLDNTIWGGVVGDDGLAGVVLGQGNAVGEAYLAFQRYALDLSRRGIILAVCSKNDEATAMEMFDRHPDMLLRRQDVACFMTNWEDKPTNLRRIAQRLNVGTDSLVFADDNAFERNLVRRELPEVAVPELPADPAGYASCIAAAGYFEALGITAEDRKRTTQYQANAQRETLRESVTDMAAYLQSLQMELHCSPFDDVGLARIVQLINKTNQFNLTTHRYTQAEVRAVLADPTALHLQFRLRDRFGDNGVIALVIGRLSAAHELLLDTWLMSCRVLGREVEAATLNVIAKHARQMGATALMGTYRPTAKNGIVRDHYSRLGFQQIADCAGETSWRLDLAGFEETEVLMTLVEGSP